MCGKKYYLFNLLGRLNMTLQEKIQKKSDEYGELASIFLEGAKFALDNQWISVDEDLPCNHEE